MKGPQDASPTPPPRARASDVAQERPRASGRPEAPAPPRALREVVGALHVHSYYSDGTGSVEDILRAARRSAVDFVVLSDHDTAAARREGWEGRHDGVTLVCATEITPRRRGHCLALGVADCLGFARLPEREYLDRIVRSGGFAIVAHPRGKHKPEMRIHHVPWLSWRHPAVRAVEIWSYMHDWIDRLSPWNLGDFGRYFTQPNRYLRGPERAVLARWDRIARTRRLAGVSGLDCHARRLPGLRRAVFSYEAMFGALRTHLFVGRDPPGVADVLEALRSARGFVALDGLASAEGTRLGAVCACGRRLDVGDEHVCGGPARLFLRLPRPARVRLVGDGRVQWEGDAAALDRRVPPGVYRFEARLRGRPWLFTNHFYLRRPAEGRP